MADRLVLRAIGEEPASTARVNKVRKNQAIVLGRVHGICYLLGEKRARSRSASTRLMKLWVQNPLIGFAVVLVGFVSGMVGAEVAAPRALAKTNSSPQFFVPGFVVRELPVRLSNQNNVEYAPDGRLFAAGYDGRVHLLRDTDGDGLEDTATTFGNQAAIIHSAW